MSIHLGGKSRKYSIDTLVTMTDGKIRLKFDYIYRLFFYTEGR
ncbi:hypothetical protein D922_00354 [Enterococcus faecalis 06-MB-DW-09]|nr:hypothetical protein D931_00534 [Enterococcus faecium 13.SD.W.09]EPH97195.1 hypothetical protein D922_00354 [Enterococcus faecalis 06-MB-DW-09]